MINSIRVIFDFKKKNLKNKNVKINLYYEKIDNTAT